MWNYEHINSICNQFEIKNQQKLHIDRILSSKSRTDSSEPYKPYFLKTKLKKVLMFEEENNKIDYENRNLLIKIINAELKPSQYSQIPQDCPAFNKKKMYTKRIYKEIEKYKENVKIYTKISKVHSNYETKKILKDSENYQKISNRIKKKNKTMMTILNFQSPNYFKKLIEKYYMNKSEDNFYNNNYRNNNVNKNKNSTNRNKNNNYNDNNNNNTSRKNTNNTYKKTNSEKKKNKLIRSESCQNLFQQKI